ncbi:uncharacterized protein [Primulina eburnea]|uniref:uncharacterized protein n=1 Tax=Primulina eburnea TaxID=1245227 RepID=UPI003C6C5C7A
MGLNTQFSYFPRVSSKNSQNLYINREHHHHCPMVREKYSGAVLADADEPKTLVGINLYIYHVSKSEWSLVIRSPNFIHHRLRNSTGGVIIQERLSPRNGIYVEMRRGCLEICKFDYGFYGLVRSSCNGLVVISDWSKLVNLYVTIPLTKQWTILPPFSTLTGDYSDCGIAFVEASMGYKVVCARGYKHVVPKTQIAILTIGVDKVWRHIDVKHLLLPTERGFIYFPMVIVGYVHWFSGNFLLTLNVETQIVHRFSVPPFPKMHGTFLPMGGNL